jgi:iron complex outermembrane receptor protein
MLKIRLLQIIAITITSSGLFAQNNDTVKHYIPVGYSVTEPDRITGSVTWFTRENFNKGYIFKAEQLLEGKIAGLSIAKAGGNPNQDFYMRIRGLNTMYSNSQPLIVIDGVPSSGMANLDPNDIETVTVLKDAASCAVYGIRGNNGVILITTRSGENGNHIIYDGSVTAEMVAKNTPVMDAKSWRAFSKEVGLGTDYGATTDWYKEIERTAFSQRHNLALEGSSNNTSWRFSINYKNIQGILRHSGFSQMNGRLSLSQAAFKEKLHLNFNMAGTDQDINYSFDEAFHYAPIYNPTSPVTTNDPFYGRYGGYFQNVLFDYYNPVAIIDLNENTGKRRLLDISLKTQLKIASFLNIDAIYAAQTDRLSGFTYYSSDDLMNSFRKGLAKRNQDDSYSQLFESTVHFNAEPLPSLFFNLHGGYSYQEFLNEGLSASVSGFLTNKLTYNSLESALDTKKGIVDISSYKNSHKMSAFFGILNLRWNKWILNSSVRYEGSSRLGKNNKWAFFPSIGAGYNWNENLKLRMSYGATGNIPSGSYYSLSKLQPYYGWLFTLNNTMIPLYFLPEYSNPDLGPERKKEFNAGIDFSLFGSKLKGSFDFYKSVARDLIINYAIYSTNYYSYYGSRTVWLNTGKIKNSGKELTLNYTVIDKSDLKYNVSFNASWGLKSTLLSMRGNFKGMPVGESMMQVGFPGSPGACCAFLTEIEEGKKIGSLIGYIFEGIDESGMLLTRDLDNSGYADYGDLTTVGNGLPKSMIGLGQSIRYMKWTVDVQFRGVFGHSLLNSNRMFYENAAMITSYNLPPTARDIKNHKNGAYPQYGGRILDIHIEKAGFVALDNLCISYSLTLPGKNSAVIYLAGNNLLYLTKYKGADPNPRYIDEAKDMGSYNSVLVPGIDRRESWSRTRSFTFGARIEL